MNKARSHLISLDDEVTLCGRSLQKRLLTISLADPRLCHTCYWLATDLDKGFMTQGGME